MLYFVSKGPRALPSRACSSRGSDFMPAKKPVDIAFHDETGQLFMLDKKERQLLRLLLSKVIKSVSGRKVLSEKLGPEFVKIGLNLLRQMGGR